MSGPGVHEQLAALGVATVYEAAGRQGLIDVELEQLLPGTSVAGPARIAACAWPRPAASTSSSRT